METPTIATYATSSAAYNTNAFGGGGGGGGVQQYWAPNKNALPQYEQTLAEMSFAQAAGSEPAQNLPKEKANMAADKVRIVKVFIVDPSTNVPLESRVIYRGEERLTEFTDQELFFEVPIQELLAKHNALRARTLNKTVTEKLGRDIFLEPIRIRDLKMIVATVAEF